MIRDSRWKVEFFSLTRRAMANVSEFETDLTTQAMVAVQKYHETGEL